MRLPSPGIRPSWRPSNRCPSSIGPTFRPRITAGRLIFVPPACDEVLPAGWIDQARADGATVITGITDRDELVKRAARAPRNLALPAIPGWMPTSLPISSRWERAGCSSSCSRAGCTISERSDDAQSAAHGRSPRRKRPSPETSQRAKAGLRSASRCMTETRERFYPVECYLLDLCLLDSPPGRRPPHAGLGGPDAGQRACDGKRPRTDVPRKARTRSSRSAAPWRPTRLDVVGGEWHERPVPLVAVAVDASRVREGASSLSPHLGPLARDLGPPPVMDLPRLLPQILHRYGYRGALHVALDDGLYPDTEQSKIRWEGCDGSVIDATTRIPLAAESGGSYLRFSSRMAESMQQDQTASVIWARWPEVRSPFWQDFERIHNYATGARPVRHVSPLLRAHRRPRTPVALRRIGIPLPVPDPSRRRSGGRSDQPLRSDTSTAARASMSGAFLDGLASILAKQPVGSPASLRSGRAARSVRPRFAGDRQRRRST